MAKVAILYICTGKYTVFWKDFYKSFERNFLRKSSKDYFVFTDEKIDFLSKKNVHKIYQKNLGWPYDTLMRFKMFESIKGKLQKYDYIFFFNANMQCIKEIKEKDFLPNDLKGEKLVMTIHPGFYKLKLKYCPYERRKASTAYVPYRSGRHYVIGALNGGKTKEYLKLISSLNKDTNIDLENNIIALVHDESHLNAYIVKRNDIKYLHPGYCYPENLSLPFEKEILMTDKKNYFNVAKLKKWKKDYLVEKFYRRTKKFLRGNLGVLFNK